VVKHELSQDGTKGRRRWNGKTQKEFETEQIFHSFLLFLLADKDPMAFSITLSIRSSRRIERFSFILSDLFLLLSLPIAFMFDPRSPRKSGHSINDRPKTFSAEYLAETNIRQVLKKVVLSNFSFPSHIFHQNKHALYVFGAHNFF
jgi:hypothetical protein